MQEEQHLFNGTFASSFEKQYDSNVQKKIDEN
jgi:hypothetical protein